MARSNVNTKIRPVYNITITIIMCSAIAISHTCKHSNIPTQSTVYLTLDVSTL